MKNDVKTQSKRGTNKGNNRKYVPSNKRVKGQEDNGIKANKPNPKDTLKPKSKGQLKREEGINKLRAVEKERPLTLSEIVRLENHTLHLENKSVSGLYKFIVKNYNGTKDTELKERFKALYGKVTFNVEFGDFVSALKKVAGNKHQYSQYDALRTVASFNTTKIEADKKARALKAKLTRQANSVKAK